MGMRATAPEQEGDIKQHGVVMGGGIIAHTTSGRAELNCPLSQAV